jgi:alginate O-acetyltransferase complex protein AlgI
MHFASLEYALLFTIVFTLYWAAGEQRLSRLLVLLAASYTFYAWWSIYYLTLIVASSALDYAVGAKIHASANVSVRRRWLLVSLAGNLGMLGVFKYFNFFSASVAMGLAELGLQITAPQLDLLLPVGISFYTFQSMSYTIDIYRRELEPERGALPFIVFVAFFPQLVAGPIVRAKQFLPQLSAPPRLDPRAATQGFFLIGLGLLKKAAIADLLAVNLVDRVFANPSLYTSTEALLGVYGYAIQIYCDFSAYSDIAIGSALLLGLTLPQNFAHPYRSANLQEFWRRWHISLSSWLRDYLYIPLGGSQGTAGQTYRNLAITMLLGGLWHGAAWTFVIWGALQGVGLAATRAFQRRFPGARDGVAWRGLAIALTFHFVCLSWVFFRSPNFARAYDLLEVIFGGSWGTANISPMLWALLVAGFLTHAIPDRVTELAQRGAHRLPPYLQAALLIGAVLGVRAAATTDAVPFIYFQF